MSSILQAIAAFFKNRVVLLALGAVAAVLIVGALMIYAASEARLARNYTVSVQPLRLDRTPSAERGERVAMTFGCQSCHRDSGGLLFDGGGMFGRLITPNLSRLQKDYSDEDLIRVIRHGIKRDGTSAIAMPSDAYSSMADDDLADVIAWMRSL
jgi:hypothetical protein